MARVYSTLERIGLSQKGEEKAVNLSAPEARMPEIVRQLMFSDEISVISVYNEMSKPHHFVIYRNGRKQMSGDNSNHVGSKKTNQHNPEISNLKLREIQSPLIASLLAGFISEIGYDKAMEVASAAIQNDAMRVGRTMAGKFGGTTIKELHSVISEIWAEENAIEFSVLEETDRRLNFNVTRCRYAELYDRLGLKEFGFCLSCNRDEPLIKGFNPRMKLLRTQTIMQGAEICDFRIVVE